MTGLTLVRAIIIVSFIVLLGSIIYAGTQANLFDGFAEVGANPWGLVGLIDLYVGFIFFAIVIAAYEGPRPVTYVWVITLFLLGNLVAAAWLITRLPALIGRLRGNPHVSR